MRNKDISTKMNLDKIIFIGRTYEEYMDMFDLSEDRLKGRKILDCPAGACSFTAEGREKGLDITAADIAYDHSLDQLELKGRQDVHHAINHMEKAKSNYIWSYFKNLHALEEYRLSALKKCTDHMHQFNEHYVPVTLPELPFEDQQFDIVLSAHFLFMYADRLDEDFHLKAIDELIRVAKEEVRIFPTVDLQGNRYKYLDHIHSYYRDMGFDTEEVKVPYEFQANADQMLVIKKYRSY
ncbi:methyltransferase domain-containing protein [Halobacillus sp. A5]|uniref:methyltransferase domain-containing protein n=1 Tax=Halobacillus sp. A5 TaxID=2880263 RepID=UPI0020A62181|nr:methyltransferase domain-containing protein [Halobacillus sp. A5]MCP3026463.1 class I SAM-dependent methyltransferase [Halobacillus sp. A5]